MNTLLQELSQFTGTTQYHRWSMITRLVATDGVIHMANGAQAFWLLDAIASHQTSKKVAKESFQVWDLQVDPNDHTAILTCHDGDHNPLARQKITWTDFPLTHIRFFVANNIIMLPTEY